MTVRELWNIDSEIRVRATVTKDHPVSGTSNRYLGVVRMIMVWLTNMIKLESEKMQKRSSNIGS